MFHWDNGLFFNRPRLALDVRRRQPHGFVSHAHADHIAAHEVAYCTPETGRLYKLRMGAARRVIEFPYREPIEFGDVRITTYPAGHCLGSAMAHVATLDSDARRRKKKRRLDCAKSIRDAALAFGTQRGNN